MPFDLARLSDPHRKWIRIGLEDIEVEVRHVGPKDQERFRQKLIRDGIIKSAEGIQFNQGRFDSFCEAFAEQYVTNWRNLKINDVENPPYSAKTMGDLLLKYAGAMTAISESLKDEADFFTESGDGSHG